MPHIHAADYLLHAANVLLIIAYLVRDILWLRWFALASSVLAVPYYLLQPNTLWPPLAWSAVFVAINLFQIARIYVERRPVVLSVDEQKLYDMAFRSIRPREFVSLLLTGEWNDASPGQQVLTAGEPVSSVSIAISGEVEVLKEGRPLGVLEPGHVIGTASALAGDVSPIDASFTNRGRYVRWPLQALRGFLDKRPEVRAAVQRMASKDLAEKLEGAIAKQQ